MENISIFYLITGLKEQSLLSELSLFAATLTKSTSNLASVISFFLPHFHLLLFLIFFSLSNLMDSRMLSFCWLTSIYLYILHKFAWLMICKCKYRAHQIHCKETHQHLGEKWYFVWTFRRICWSLVHMDWNI